MSGPTGFLRQASAIGVALALWSLVQVPAVWTLLLAYALACWLVGGFGFAEALASMRRGARGLVLGALLLPGAVALWRTGPELASNEGWSGLWPNLQDRLRLEALPSIAPPLVSGAEPQTFYVQADTDPGTKVRVQLGPRAKPLAAEALGAGLFRVDYDPRRDGPPFPPNGTLAATIWVGDRASERELRSATPLPHPRWFARSPDGLLAATVSSESDELVIASSSGLQRRVPVGDQPSDCAFVSATTIAVSHFADPRLWLIDAHSGATVRQLNLGDRQGRMAVAPSGTRLVVARSGLAPELVVIALDAGRSATAAQRVALPVAADWLAFGPDDDTLLVATRADARIHRLRARDGGFAQGGELSLGRPVVTWARSLDGAQLLAATTDYRPDGSRHLGNHFVQDQLLTIDVARLQVTRALLTARRSPRQSKPGDVDRGLSPLGIAAARDGWLVAFAGSDELWRLSADRPEPLITDLDDLELFAPHGVTELADGAVLVSSPASGAIGVLPRDGLPKVLRLAPDDAYLLAHDREALAQRLGERGFYEGTRAGISCQSCHLHADSDLAAHNLGDHRLLPTLGVRGLLGTAPFLRDGSYPRLGDLDHVAQLLYRGYLRHAPARKQTLEAFLAALPRPRALRSGELRDPSAERRGLQAFVSARCPLCHAPPAFTQLSQHRPLALFPERTGENGYVPIDVPSLLSVGGSAPYLSDGRAQTLLAVIGEHNRSNHHGDSARLSPAQRRDLVTLLEAL